MAEEVSEQLYDEARTETAWNKFKENTLFPNRFRLMKDDVEKAIDLVRKIRNKELLPEYILEAKNDQKDNVAPVSAAAEPDDEAAS